MKRKCNKKRKKGLCGAMGDYANNHPWLTFLLVSGAIGGIVGMYKRYQDRKSYEKAQEHLRLLKEMEK